MIEKRRRNIKEEGRDQKKGEEIRLDSESLKRQGKEWDWQGRGGGLWNGKTTRLDPWQQIPKAK